MAFPETSSTCTSTQCRPGSALPLETLKPTGAVVGLIGTVVTVPGRARRPEFRGPRIHRPLTRQTRGTARPWEASGLLDGGQRRGVVNRCLPGADAIQQVGDASALVAIVEPIREFVGIRIQVKQFRLVGGAGV